MAFPMSLSAGIIPLIISWHLVNKDPAFDTHCWCFYSLSIHTVLGKIAALIRSWRFVYKMVKACLTAVEPCCLFTGPSVNLTLIPSDAHRGQTRRKMALGYLRSAASAATIWQTSILVSGIYTCRVYALRSPQLFLLYKLLTSRLFES